MIPRVGQKIGPYEILGRLGSGGMGLVFSAWDARLHRDVAIKLLKDEFLNPTMRSRFLGEARAASRLNHPNICTIFDIGEEQDSPYMVMELLKGETLRGRMQQGLMPVDHILQVATQVADALSVAHDQGIVHRDIKPANVVLVDKPNGAFQTKVLDFGLAKVDLGNESRTGLTTTGMTVGTVSYMSPEQARGELLDGRSDLFSLGVLMYEMASGKLPFDGATSALIFVKLLNQPPEPLRNLNANLPRALEQVINGCLQKSRDDRYQNAQELVSALHKAAQTLTSSEKTASWISKLASGLKRETSVAATTEAEGEEAPPEPTPLLLSSEEAFLKPFRPQWKQGSSSIHYQPVNQPFDAQGGQPQHATPHEQEAAISAGSFPAEAHASTIAEGTESDARASSRAREPRLDWLNSGEEAPPHDEPPPEVQEPHRSGLRIIVGSVLALAILIVTVVVVLSKKQSRTVRQPPTTVISLINNNTGDNTLGSVVAVGLELALEQSPFVGLRHQASRTDSSSNVVPQEGDAAFRALQAEARGSGASTFSFAEAHMEGSAYVFSLRVYDTEKGTEIGNCASTAASRERIVGAIDGLATSLRSVMGESGASIHENSVPLSRSATGNVDALVEFRHGEIYEASGHLLDAISAFERVAQMEPRFVEVQFRLAELYNRQHAEVSAAVAATRAQGVVDGDDRNRLLAKGLQSYLATGDLKDAEAVFSELTKKYPLNSENFVRLAAVQLAQGEFTASLSSSEEAVRLAPASASALRQRMLAQLALGKNDSVPQLAHAGPATIQNRPAQLASLVSGQVDTLSGLNTSAGTDDFDYEIAKAEVLDASGQLDEGLTVWRAIVLRALSVPQLASSASFALSHAALDRALAGDCVTATNLQRDAATYPAGAETLFALGISSGLCGNLDDVHAKLTALTATYPQSFRVMAFYTSDLNALVQLKSGALSDALATLQSAEQYDLISFNAYLRGQVYLAQKQPQPATVEFQAMLRRPGALVNVMPEGLPIGYLALARAFVANGDVPNATQSYQKLATILQRADATDPILIETRSAASR